MQADSANQILKVDGQLVKWSMKLARIAGIDMFVHWTFLILMFWLLGIHIAQIRLVESQLEVMPRLLSWHKSRKRIRKRITPQAIYGRGDP